jgi:hypothetical protein
MDAIVSGFPYAELVGGHSVAGFRFLPSLRGRGGSKPGSADGAMAAGWSAAGTVEIGFLGPTPRTQETGGSLELRVFALFVDQKGLGIASDARRRDDHSSIVGLANRYRLGLPAVELLRDLGRLVDRDLDFASSFSGSGRRHSLLLIRCPMAERIAPADGG